MSDANAESTPDPADLRAELAAVEAELDALAGRRSGFDLRREAARVRGVVASLLGRDAEVHASYDSERLSGRELGDRIRDLQRRRAALKTRLERLD